MSVQQPIPVLSAERLQKAFADSLAFEQFVNQAQVNQELLKENFEAFELSGEERALIDAISEPVDVLVLAHDWCGDVVSNLPLFAKIERETGKLKLRILNRDPDNQDLAEAYPHQDGKSHIPTYVFFDRSGKQLGVFIERPESITALFPKWKEQFWSLHPEWAWRDKPFSEVDSAVQQVYFKYLLAQRPGVRNEEKRAIIEIIRTIIGGTKSNMSI